ncbi:uncharacterized protein LOC116805434 [Drosophila grimshawi]|uniref:uncharacterized protein LOC116805434 n=1 Tax=Drosophila grimshawi TaxID=7222 RepID=UPI000C86FF55|nr:uncharacterized protein LOC116805434 [Drosophila grimshawi]
MCHNLIDLVESKSNLWNASNNDYKNRKKRESAWGEIAVKMNLPKDEVSNKWNLLRQQFRNAYNKVKESKSGRATAIRMPPNPFYNALLFLQPILRKETVARTPNNIMSKESESSVSPFTTKSEVFHFDQSYDDSDPLSSHEPIQSPSSNSTPTPKRRKVAKTYVHSRAMIKQTRHEDEFELWGKSVAATLRNYPDEHAVRIAKSKMNQVMASLEAGDLDGIRNIPTKFTKRIKRS